MDSHKENMEALICVHKVFAWSGQRLWKYNKTFMFALFKEEIMKKNSLIKKGMAALTAAVLAMTTLTACGGSDVYNDYAAAYNKVTAKGGLEAQFDVSLEMDGEKQDYDGDFKLNTSGSDFTLYYEMNTGDGTIIEFSDGDYIYTETGDKKVKYSLGASSISAEPDTAKEKESSATFDTSAFLNQFSTFMEAGKIKELGLLSPIEKAAISKIEKDGDTYKLTFSDALVKKYLNTLVQNETGKGADETIQINELNDFTYEATEKNGMISDIVYKGVLKVDVPGSLLTSGEDTTYDLDLVINTTFVNPGEAVEVELPSTDGFEELK